MASNEVVCAVCGANNPANIARCRSCGAKLEALGAGALTEEEERARELQQEGFEWKWVFVAFAIYMVLQAAILVGLRFVISSYDPQGLPGLLISAGVWFVGGIIVGAISPGKTFIEPAVGALLAVAPTIAYLMWIADVYKLSLLAYVIAGLLGVMMTLVGAFIGEKLQMATRRQART